MPRLSERLHVPEDALRHWAGLGDEAYRSFEISKGEKSRRIDDPQPRLKLIQRRIRERLLQGMFAPSKHVYGSVRRRHIGQVGRHHVGREWVVALDIRRLYPSIVYQRVYHFWECEGECSPDVSGLLTRLTTCNGALPTGAPTSSEIANLILTPVDHRLVGFCQKHHLGYTRWMDDLIISGSAPNSPGTVLEFVLGVIREHGFPVAAEKVQVIPITCHEEATILSKIEVSRVRPRVDPEYASRVLDEVRAAVSAFQDTGFDPTTDKQYKQAMGRIAFIRLLQGKMSSNLRQAEKQLRTEYRRAKRAPGNNHSPS